MVSPAACTPVIDALIKIEPLLSNAIVFNLAYIALPRFSYIEEVRDLVAARIGELQKQNLDSIVKSTEWFKQAKGIAEIRTIRRVGDKRQPGWLSVPGVWGFFYNLLFYWPIGRLLSYLATGCCLLMLIVGMGDEIEVIDLGTCSWPQHAIGIDFAISLFALLWPIVVVASGIHVTRSAGSWFSYQTKNLTLEVAGNAVDAVAAFKAQNEAE